MNVIPSDVKEQFDEIQSSIQDRLQQVKDMASSDLEIDEFDLDKALLDIPKLHTKWLTMFTDETINLKELYGFKEKIRLERWKYWQGKQDDQYYAKYGLLHEKILKSDIDKYLASDPKLTMVNDIVTLQKALVEFIERTLKELGNRGFHVKSIIDWRRFSSGA